MNTSRTAFQWKDDAKMPGMKQLGDVPIKQLAAKYKTCIVCGEKFYTTRSGMAKYCLMHKI